MTDRNFATGQGGYAAGDLNLFHRPEKVLDCAKSNMLATETAQMLDMLEGTYVFLVMLEVLTPEGGVLTVDVGDGDDVDGFLDGVNANAAAGTRYPSMNTITSGAGTVISAPATQLYGQNGGKYYAADDTLDILINDNADLAMLRITAGLLNMVGSLTSGIVGTAV